MDEEAYDHHPKFNKFKVENNLPFEPYDTFGKSQISKRAQLMVKLVDLVWNPDMFMCESVQAYIDNEEEVRELTDKENRARIPDGEYYLSENREGFGVVKATMVVTNGVFTVKKGSTCAPVSVGMPWAPEARRSAIIEDCILVEDVNCYSPSTAGWVVLGKANNGWIVWKDSNGVPLDTFRRK